MDPVQNKKDVFLFLHPGGLSILQAMGPAYDVFCLGVGEDLLEKIQVLADLSTVRSWVCPTVSSVPPQVLPVCQLAARVLMVSDLRMACLFVSLKNGSPTPPTIFQTSERW